MNAPARAPAAALLVLALAPARAQPAPGDGDPDRGRTFFQQNCALCHATVPGAGGQPVSGQGPSLAGVLGRRAGSLPGFGYSKAMADSGVTWDAASLDKFLAAPTLRLPGTTMPAAVPFARNRADVIAFLSTLAAPAAPAQAPEAAASAPAAPNPGDWMGDAAGKAHRIDLEAMPAPFSTASAGNGPQVVAPPGNAALSVPPGFTVRLFASGLSGPRLLRVAPNHDIFVAETRANRIRVLRAEDGASAPSKDEIFADGLDRPFGVAFYPPGDDPQWLYVANNNSVVRFPYHGGDLRARGPAQTIVPVLCETTGGHTTRDVAFSLDGRRMFVSVGSGSNVAEGLAMKTVAEIRAWEADHGRGAAWGAEAGRADIVTCDPQGRGPLRAYATGVRNGVGIAVDPASGELWVSTNERDALGDDLVPDYITHLKEGGFYGWPWYYMGSHEDPRHAGERPDLAGVAVVPDVPVQSHSASLEMTFYTATQGAAVFPAEYRGDIFAAFHGSWNRTTRTGYKVVRVRRHDGVATGEYDDFLTGFVVDNRSVWGRPVGVAVAHDGALLVTEDGNSTVWRISYGATTDSRRPAAVDGRARSRPLLARALP